MSQAFFNKNIPSLRPTECNFCGKILGRKTTLLEHIQDMHKKTKKILCTIDNCGYKTNRVGNYNLHLEKVHKISLPVIRCHTAGCGKRSRNETSMIKHMIKCKGKSLIKAIKCTEENCSEEFLTEKGLKNHFKIKHDSLLIEKKLDIQIFHEEIEELLF